MSAITKAVSNPLTLIALFCSVTETGGTVVLPFLSAQNQGTYMWFLIWFPLLLVVLFFSTLLFRHHVLYAPGDFRDDESFFHASRIEGNVVSTVGIPSVTQGPPPTVAAARSTPDIPDSKLQPARSKAAKAKQ
jgi:hypothetical protein